jgi:hypothetical protein
VVASLACVGQVTDPLEGADGAVVGGPDGGGALVDSAPGSPDAAPGSPDSGQVADRCEPNSALVARVDPARLLTDLHYLVDMGERRSHAAQQEAADYIRQQLSGLANVVVSDHTYGYGGQQYANVEATIIGSELPGEYVLFGGHYDSTSNSPTSAPGADDNASGTTALMELTRALAGCSPRRSVRVIFFSNEEIGTVGSQAYASALRSELSPSDVVGFIAVDMVGYGPANEDLDVAGRNADAALVNAMTDAVETWTTLEVAPRIDDHCG